VRVAAVGLNPVDWKVAGSAEAAGRFGVTLPAGFGNDFAGVIDEVGGGVAGFAAGDRVYGGARGRAVADFAVVRPGADPLLHTPDGVDDMAIAAGEFVVPIAATFPIEQARAAVELQRAGHVHGKVVITLS
jgi:NADPH:quinone reductase-like Zn-dependent oxidoreductase